MSDKQECSRELERNFNAEVVLVFIDDNVDYIEEVFKKYLKIRKLEEKYDYIKYNYEADKDNDAGTLREKIFADIKNYTNLKDVCILVDYELYTGKEYVQTNEVARKKILKEISEYIKEETEKSFYMFLYTSVKERDLLNYIYANNSYFSEQSRKIKNLKIFKEGLRMIYDRPIQYMGRFDKILQSVNKKEEKFWF